MQLPPLRRSSDVTGAIAATQISGRDGAAVEGTAPVVDGAVPVSLLLAQMCWVEGGSSLKDCAAMVYVIKRRAGWAKVSVEDMVWAYSALDAKNDRARFARKLPDGDLEEWNDRQNRRWAEVRRVALRAFEGKAPNPARGATHWGARNIKRDMERAVRAIEAGRWRTVQAPTLNAFYADVR